VEANRNPDRKKLDEGRRERQTILPASGAFVDESLTRTLEWDNKRKDGVQAISDWCSVPRTTGKKVPHGEESMEFEKDQFEDDEELSRLEDDEELGGEPGAVVEEEEELLIVEEEPADEGDEPAAKPAAKPAPKKASPKKAAAKKAKKPAKKKPAKKAKAKPKKKAAKKAKKRGR
jgi:hypothetical protein